MCLGDYCGVCVVFWLQISPAETEFAENMKCSTGVAINVDQLFLRIGSAKGKSRDEILMTAALDGY